jgi:hypothetical protein
MSTKTQSNAYELGFQHMTKIDTVSAATTEGIRRGWGRRD